MVLFKSGVRLQSVQNGCPELDTCFSRTELVSWPGEARLVVQSATPELGLRDWAILGTPRQGFLKKNYWIELIIFHGWYGVFGFSRGVFEKNLVPYLDPKRSRIIRKIYSVFDAKCTHFGQDSVLCDWIWKRGKNERIMWMKWYVFTSLSCP